MSLPDVEEGRIAENYTRNTLSLRLFSNDITLDETTTLASLTEVAGGGYAAINLASGDWTVTIGAPTETVQAEQEFSFTGATTAPGTIYGYYYVDNVTGLYVGGENFPGAVTPVVPVAGSKIRITPKVLVS